MPSRCKFTLYENKRLALCATNARIAGRHGWTANTAGHDGHPKFAGSNHTEGLEVFDDVLADQGSGARQ